MRRPLVTLTLILSVALASAAAYALLQPRPSHQRTVANACPQGLVREHGARDADAGACARLGHPEGAELLQANQERAGHELAPFRSVRGGAGEAAAAQAA